jgi:hypothetical protein
LEMHSQFLICVGKFWRREGSTLLTSLSLSASSVFDCFFSFCIMLSFLLFAIPVLCANREFLLCVNERE